MVDVHRIVGDPRHLALPFVGHWRVYELSGSSYDRRASLIFECEAEIRRVRNYPPGWRTLSDEDLYKLSWST